jgi:predicted flap endonuclease-1-like 5' DNA nuclease
MRELQGQVMRTRQELATTQMELRTTRGEVYNLRAELASAKTRIEELEAELRKAQAAAQSAVPTAVGDDLKAIKGIGPKFEKLLRSAGVTTLAQIAGWSDGEAADGRGVVALESVRTSWRARSRANTFHEGWFTPSIPEACTARG